MAYKACKLRDVQEVCASPKRLKTHATLSEPNELLNHDVILFRREAEGAKQNDLSWAGSGLSASSPFEGESCHHV